MIKTIGTLVPLSALRSAEDEKNKIKHSSFKTGKVFLNWLKETGQNAWQMLPLYPTHIYPTGKPANSPYRGYGVGLDSRYLSEEASKLEPTTKELNQFIKQHKEWLPDFALFCAIRDHLGTDNWVEWPKEIRVRKADALKEWQEKLSEKYHAHILEQWRLHSDFNALKEKANQLKIELIGDLSFYLPLQSPLVWRFQEYFELNKNFELKRMSGTLNGPKAHFGRQVWGHPLYAWQEASAQKYLQKLWQIRVRYLFCLYSTVRIDFATGFYIYGALDTKDEAKDVVLKGPGTKMLRLILKEAEKYDAKVFTEDASTNVQAFHKDIIKFNLPGMNIFRFAYNEKLHIMCWRYANVFAYPKNSVAYTSTHDTETLLAYLEILTDEEVKMIAATSNAEFTTNRKVLAERIREQVINSPAERIIVSFQDWLLTTDRINIPGTEKIIGDTNWQYRIHEVIEKLPTRIKFKA